jgi:hypothetical protein
MTSIHTVEVGDWSRDGHNQSDTYMVSVPDSLEKVHLGQMVAEAEKHIGKGSLKDQCRAYEDSEFPVALLAGIVQTALKLGVTIGASAHGEAVFKDEETGKYTAEAWDDGVQIFDLEDEATLDSPDNVSMDSESFFGLWVVLANIGLALNSLEGISEYTTPKGKEPKSHQIGGYGLFFS